MRWPLFVLMAAVLLVGSSDGRDSRWIQQRLQQIKQSDAMAWRTIPWAATLTEAREQSAKERRPVFLFTHDGNLETGRC